MAKIKELQYCSFCRTNDADESVGMLIVGHDKAAICDNCVFTCLDIINEADPPADGEPN